MAKIGWVKIYRRLQEHWLWQDKPFSKGQAWIDLLMLANHEDKKIPYKGEVITCERGTVNLSISVLANRWGWSRKKAKRFLELLESDSMVTVKATTHRTTVTIENYALYNDLGTTNYTTDAQQGNSKGTAEEQQVPTTKNDKNDKNDKKDIYIGVPAELREAVMEFAAMRKKKKAPISSEQTVTRLLNRLDKLATTTEEKIAILHQSTDHCWTDVYALKGDKDNGSYNNERDRNDEAATGDYESPFAGLQITRL